MLKEMEESSCSEVPFGFGHPCSSLLYILSACARCLGCSISSDDPQDPSTEEENGEDSSVHTVTTGSIYVRVACGNG
ncbi:hypothetical protein MUK42_19587 [Musa troglodytarum]|uniref:Uncharacterized protein n=1 Tax=Musa troglodytarum TaxID=320322 RepID=A0A9E7G0Y3_9LILI|nr:hypothetical protein MUK42_19587 [Musa troglodytarum]